MSFDFTYGNSTINSSGGFIPTKKNAPTNPREVVDTYADIANIPNPYVGLTVTVKADETNNNKMTDYKVISLKSNNLGIADMLIDQVQRMDEYLGVLKEVPAEYVTETEMNEAIANVSSGGGLTSDQLVTLNKVPTIEQDVANLKTTLGDKNGLPSSDTNVVSSINRINNSIGVEELSTTAKTLKGAINEVFQDVDNGKTLIASAITDKGIVTSNNDTFQTMADNILSISSSTQPSGQDIYREGRVLVWEDDFNGDSLDTSVWSYELGNIRNNELQVYTNNSKNVYVENSNLVLKAIKEDCEAYDKNTKTTKTFNWTSGSIHTNNKKEFKYGRIEAKIKLTNVKGSFPAFWTLGAGYCYQYTNDSNMGNKGVLWPFCGEIDIMEHFGYNTSTSHGSFYSTDESITQPTSLERLSSRALDFDKYHIYSLEWTEDKLEMFVDDILVSSANISDPKFVSFKQPHCILLDHAMGASGGTPLASLTECYFYVDWVRVYAPAYENISSITLSESDITLSNMGDTHIVTAEFKPEAACDKTLVWESSNPDIAKVYGGKIYAISNGTCNITATHGDVSATCSVTVGTGVVTSTLESISAVYTQGDTIVYPTTPLNNLKSNLVVTGTYSDSTTKTITDYSLSGTLTTGTSTITVTYNNKTTTFNVTVSEAAAEKVLESISAVYTQGNKKIYPFTLLDSLKSNLVVTGNYSDGSTKAITSYSLSGTLTVGTSTITVTYNDKTTTFDVIVSEATEGNILFYFDSNERTDVDTIFNITKYNINASSRCEAVYNSDGYLEIIEKEKSAAGQAGYIRAELKNFAVSGNIEIEARLSVDSYRDTNDPDTEGVRIGIDNGTEGIYVSLSPKFGVRYFSGNSLIPANTSIENTITANTMFNLKINIDFINKDNAKIYMNDVLLDTIDYSKWTKSAYSNRNNFFVMSRNAIATVNTIKIKNI